MGISIKRAETEAKARELALYTGESLTDAIDIAITERLERQRPTEVDRARIEQETKTFLEWVASLGLKDGPSREEIEAEMYDEYGLPR